MLFCRLLILMMLLSSTSACSLLTVQMLLFQLQQRALKSLPKQLVRLQTSSSLMVMMRTTEGTPYWF